jgi:hypothetical protein
MHHSNIKIKMLVINFMLQKISMNRITDELRQLQKHFVNPNFIIHKQILPFAGSDTKLDFSFYIVQTSTRN